MADVILEALKDGIKAFLVLFIVYIVLSFVELKIANKMEKGNKLSPLYGALVGLVPQCGISVIGADLYSKKHISTGTLLAIFIACSDEAIPIILSEGGSKSLMIIPLMIIKLILGFVVGFIVDRIISDKVVDKHLQHCDNHDIHKHTGCCHHTIEGEEKDKFEEHVWHPFIHSLKLFGYILIINLLFGTVVYLIGENNLSDFLNNSKYLSVLYSVLIGLIPNCASSLILSKLYISGGISFGATLAGLCVNAGLGMIFIFKDKSNIKRNMCILLALIVISLLAGYITCIISGF